MDQDKIGRFIYQLRTDKKLSQYKLADMIPISRQAVSKWERGESIPDSSTLMRLSEIFNVSINELLIGERLKENSIESLEKTTLSIIDENNRKSKIIKRNFKISMTIITILLLSFLSYYFINSYNSTKVYMINADNEVFKIRNGIYVSTNEKNYMKIGNIEYNDDINIDSIKLYYKVDNKNKTIVEDIDIENFTIVDPTGYTSKINKTTRSILENSYLEINYNNDQKEIIKLGYTKDFTNKNLFFKKNKKYNIQNNKKSVGTGLIIGETIKNTEKEETKVEEEPSKELVTEETVTAITEHKEEIIEENIQEDSENKFDLDKILNNLKEQSMYFDNTYIYESEAENIIFLYYDKLGQLTLYLNDSFMWDYYINEDRYNCSGKYADDCSNDIKETLEKYFN